MLASFTVPFTGNINRKYIILFGETLVFIGTILLPFTGKADRYWPLVFPAFILGSSGMMLTYMHTKYVPSVPPTASVSVF